MTPHSSQLFQVKRILKIMKWKIWFMIGPSATSWTLRLVASRIEYVDNKCKHFCIQNRKWYTLNCLLFTRNSGVECLLRGTSYIPTWTYFLRISVQRLICRMIGDDSTKILRQWKLANKGYGSSNDRGLLLACKKRRCRTTQKT